MFVLTAVKLSQLVFDQGLRGTGMAMGLAMVLASAAFFAHLR